MTPNSNYGRTSRLRLLVLALIAALPITAGCRQRMADQPYYRPLEQAEFFPDQRSARPLENGVIHRGQHLESDPMVTGLTREEWLRAYEYEVPAKIETTPLSDPEKVKRAIGAPRYDPTVAANPKVFVEEYPFQITQEDLKRGQDRYTIFCAECHGPYGNGQGKIWERGYLQPTSFHTKKVAPSEATVTNPQGLGMSRGYSLWGIQIAMDKVPVGYYFEVMTKGYGGMPSYSAQVPPEDRWRIIAYIRVLQMSQQLDTSKLPPEVQKLLPGAGGKK